MKTRYTFIELILAENESVNYSEIVKEIRTLVSPYNVHFLPGYLDRCAWIDKVPIDKTGEVSFIISSVIKGHSLCMDNCRVEFRKLHSIISTANINDLLWRLHLSKEKANQRFSDVQKLESMFAM